MTLSSKMPTVQTHGYAIIPGVFNEEELTRLKIEADRLALEHDSTCVRHIRNKSKVFDHLATSPEIFSLIPPDMRPVRSILFDKTAEQNWPVPWHQDLTVAVTRKESVDGYGPWSVKDAIVHVQPPVELLEAMVTARIHLDETPAINGALRVIPGSHRSGKIASDQVGRPSDAEAITCECASGDILLMSPLILHTSSRSSLPSRRRVLHFEYAPQDGLHSDLEWHEANFSRRIAG